MKSLFIVKHPAGTSREVGMTEALAADKAIAALGLEVVGGAYAQEGSAIDAAIRMVMGGDDG